MILPPGNYVADPAGEQQSCPFTVNPDGTLNWYDGQVYVYDEGEDAYYSLLPPPRHIRFEPSPTTFEWYTEPTTVGDWRPV